MNETFKLITGRTRSQADGLHRGKRTEAYREATERAEMNQGDMDALGLKEGAMVEMRAEAGRVEVRVYHGELPAGLLFMPLGPAANRLIDVETDATGTPRFKGLSVVVRPVVWKGEAATHG